MAPTASIVIPAHNEAGVIGRLLGAITAQARPGEFLICVACNGCSDDTAAVARSYPGVEVVEIEEASKTAALNAGDAHAGDVFPRLYLDADITVDLAAVRAVSRALDTPEPRAAAPRLHYVTDGRPLVVKGFYRIFGQTSWVTDNLVGSGFYGVSRAGRRRFAEFPPITNDDQFLRALFSSEERISVADHTFSVQTPHTAAALVRAKARVAEGITEYVAIENEAKRERGEDTRPPRGGSLVWVRMARRPGNWLPLVAYAYVRLAARRLRRSHRRQGSALSWGQDRTTRPSRT